MGRRLFGLLLAAVLLLPGCAQEQPEQSTTDPGSVTVGTVHLQPELPDTTADGKVLFVDYACYTGRFVEDGTGDPVEKVAAVLVKNLSDEYLDYAQLIFEVDGKRAEFQVTGLHSGASAWVLEKNRLQTTKDAVYRFIDSACAYGSGVVSQSLDLSVTMGDGTLTVRNNSGMTMHDVYVYYKRVHEDGNYLGGITYRCSIGSLEAGEQREMAAGYCSSTGCRIVRIEWNKEDPKQ